MLQLPGWQLPESLGRTLCVGTIQLHLRHARVLVVYLRLANCGVPLCLLQKSLQFCVVHR